MRLLCSLTVLLLVPNALAGRALPKHARLWLEAHRDFTVATRLQPQWMRGDFDGDGKSDVALSVERKRKRGVVVLFAEPSRRPVVIGAGTRFNDMDNLDFTQWACFSGKRRVPRGAGEGRPPRLRSDALLLVWEESASAVVYWNGERFVWYQQGD